MIIVDKSQYIFILCILYIYIYIHKYLVNNLAKLQKKNMKIKT